ncbi:MAG: YjjW family glycine radical enzyme activase [Bacillota bacterium]
MALVSRIIRFSCVDGPGNRLVIFFQGCNFTCTYCHNPETIRGCTSCGICVYECPVKALSIVEGKVLWDSEICISCDNCIKSCPHMSSPRVKDYSVDELFSIISKTAPFIEGITVSGGECTLNAGFLTELFRRVKNELHLTCFVDTNGGVDLSAFPELIELTDSFMLDIKSIEAEEHLRLTGMPNEIVLKNLHMLLYTDKLYEVRTVIAPGSDSEKTVAAVAEIIKDKCAYKLLKYRKHGVRKQGLEIHGTFSPSDEYIDEMRQLAESKGAKTVISQ